ncbi:MAG: DNA adenine methylase [Candidatus Electrothrix sp. AW5]|nr:DNA adenine methylase [Candidatus Electrothrix gigas]
MAHTNSPLRYPGGKSALSSYLAEVIKLNGIEGGVYIEPYVGGGGAALNLLFKGIVSDIIINDFDPVIYAFWHSVLNDTYKFTQRIKEIPLNINEWHKQKEILSTYKEHRLFDIGFAAFYLNRCNRSGILKAGPIGGKHQTGNYTLDARFNRINLIDKILRIGKYKKHITLHHKDAIDFLIKIVPNFDGPKLIYLDPPYYQKGGQLYLNAYAHEDHENLAWVLGKESMPDCWVLTYDDSPEIKELYKERKTSTYSLCYSASHAKKGNELLITSPSLQLPAEVDTKFVLA